MKEYNRRAFLKTLAAGTAALGLSASFCKESILRQQPNILLFLVDDMGWMDSSLYGSQYYKTPNMERLAKQSMMFTNAYAANPLCSPTRASILAGQYPARLKITQAITNYEPAPDDSPEPVIPNKDKPNRKMCVPKNKNFLPLTKYTLAEAMKDAGYETCFIGKWHLGSEGHYPEDQGFDKVIGGTKGGGPPGGYFDPFKDPRLPNRKKGEYVTDRLTDEACAYLEQHKDKPFFLNVWHYAVHGPWGHKEEITSKFRDKKDPRGKQNNPVMASMLYSMDESLGKILDKLDELNLVDNTIVIFMSDNGGNIHREVEGKPPTNNSPLRGGKATIYEGGTREPMMVRWPGVVKPGSKSDEIVSTIDFYPTILDMVGIKANLDHIFDGESFVQVLKGKGSLKREAIFCHFPHYVGVLNLPSTYVRKRDWKLIRFYGEGENRSNKYELYNLKDDIGETQNLAEKMPEKVLELDSLIDSFLKQTGALVPVKNSDYDPNAKP